MAVDKFNFEFKYKNVLGNIRSPKVWQFRLAQNMAFLSNDSAVVRHFWRVDCSQFMTDAFLSIDRADMFLAHHTPDQAFCYFGLIPMIVTGVQNLMASAGFVCESGDKEVDDKLNKCIADNKLQELFSQGVYYESGLGDFAYRISYDPSVDPKPLIDIIEPQHIRLVYYRKRIKTIVIKEPSDMDDGLELHEVYSKNKDGYVVVEHFIYKDNNYVIESDSKSTYADYLQQLGLTKEYMKPITLPLREFPIIYKQNHTHNMVYKGERGVPDIQGLETIEDKLSESISDLMDAIRKGGVLQFIDASLLKQDKDGNIQGYDSFNHRIVKVNGSSKSNKELVQTTQGDIKWEAYVETARYLISSALNKVGISPTTIGITGLESINSSQESQDAREKPSLRKREESLKTWTLTLKDLLNRYLQMCDYVEGEDILDYSDYIHIKFNKYVNPTQESIVELLGLKLDLALISQVEAMQELDPTLTKEQAINKLMGIVNEKRLLQEATQPTDLGNIEPDGALNTDNTEVNQPSNGNKEPTQGVTVDKLD